MGHIAGNSKNESPDAHASVNRKYNLIPISEPHTLDVAQWSSTTDLSRKVRTTLKREQVTLKPSSIRGPHYKAPTHTINAITNATHTRHARNKRAPIIR